MSYGIELAQAAGGQAAGNIINEGMGLLLAGPKRKAQMKTARQMQDLQMQGQKEMTDFNMKKQLEMWENTGYGAQVDQMKRAGINPALLYGMGSGGGQTSNVETGNVSGQHAEGVQAPRGAEGMGLMIGQMGLLEAQRKNIEADTRLKNVDANKKEGIDTEVGKETAKNLAADTQNKEAQTKLTESQTRLNAIEEKIQGQSADDQVDIIRLTALRIKEEIQQLKLDNKLSEEQMNDKIKLMRAQIAEISTKAALNIAMKHNVNQDTKLKIQEILESQARMKAMAEQLMIMWDNRADTRQKTEMELKQGDRDDGWDFLKDLLPTFLFPIGRGLGGLKTPTTVTGFR